MKHKAKREEAEEEEEERGRRREEREEEGLFHRAREPDEVLEEVLSEHHLNDEFIDYAVRRSKREGGVHPMELQAMIEDMKSGVKTPKEIPYIIEDYYSALQAEQEKAREHGLRISYPLRRGERTRIGGVGLEREREDLGLGRREWRGYDRYREAYGAEGPAPLTRDDVVDLMEKVLDRKEREDRLTSIEKQMIQQRADTEKSIDVKFGELKDLLAAQQAKKVEPEGLSRQELLEALDKRDKDAQLRYLETKSRDDKERTDKLVDALDKERVAAKEREEKLLDKIEEISRSRPSISTEGYNKDETRLVADALQILGQKTPIRDAGKIVVEFIKPTTEATPPKRERSGESGIASLLPSEYVKEE